MRRKNKTPERKADRKEHQLLDKAKEKGKGKEKKPSTECPGTKSVPGVPHRLTCWVGSPDYPFPDP